jgi:hypothetical protein
MNQPDLFTPAADRDHEVDRTNLRAHLMSHGWQTRGECCRALVWDERKLRAVAESMGSDIVRCQMGFKLTDSLSRDDVSAALQGCDAGESQAKKQLAYVAALRRRIHSIIG